MHGMMSELSNFNLYFLETTLLRNRDAFAWATLHAILFRLSGEWVEDVRKARRCPSVTMESLMVCWELVGVIVYRRTYEGQ